MTLFKKDKAVKTYWLVDDDTAMPIACDSYEKAVKVVNEYFADEVDRMARIYKVIK